MGAGPLTNRIKMYYINIHFFFYNGHPIERIDRSFDTLEEAKQFLANIGVTWQISPQAYKSAGLYRLSHAEYTRPTFKIRRSRDVN
jgi:hypothetical protein